MKKEAEEELASGRSPSAEAKKQIDLRDAARARSADVMGFNSVFDQKKEGFKKEQLRRDKLTLQYELESPESAGRQDAAKIQAERS